MTLKEEIASRNLPDLFGRKNVTDEFGLQDWEQRRKEIVALLKTEYLGQMPENYQTEFEVPEENPDAYGGKATARKVQVTVRWEGGSHTFPFQLILPKRKAGCRYFCI